MKLGEPSTAILSLQSALRADPLDVWVVRTTLWSDHSPKRTPSYSHHRPSSWWITLITDLCYKPPSSQAFLITGRTIYKHSSSQATVITDFQCKPQPSQTFLITSQSLLTFSSQTTLIADLHCKQQPSQTFFITSQSHHRPSSSQATDSHHRPHCKQQSLLTFSSQDFMNTYFRNSLCSLIVYQPNYLFPFRYDP